MCIFFHYERTQMPLASSNHIVYALSEDEMFLKGPLRQQNRSSCTSDVLTFEAQDQSNHRHSSLKIWLLKSIHMRSDLNPIFCTAARVVCDLTPQIRRQPQFTLTLIQSDVPRYPRKVSKVEQEASIHCGGANGRVWGGERRAPLATGRAGLSRCPRWEATSSSSSSRWGRVWEMLLCSSLSQVETAIGPFFFFFKVTTNVWIGKLFLHVCTFIFIQTNLQIAQKIQKWN